MENLKTVMIKNKPYVEVNERLKYFRENYEEYSLTSDIISIQDGVVVMKATILNPEGRVLATGTAYEKEDSSFINKTSYIENCETSAWGRCLANFGIGLDTSVASYDEVANAVSNQSSPRQANTTRHIQNSVREQSRSVSGQSDLLEDEIPTRVCECGNIVQQRISKAGKVYYKCQSCGEWVNE